jgi:phage terminase large subunit-like protein
MEQIDATRLPAEGLPLWLDRIVVAVDPAVSTSEGSDETGIVACGIDEAGRFYVLDDQSARYAPHQWAQRAINTYHRWNADRIVIETNQGGAMVTSTLRHVDPNVPIREVHASRGKAREPNPSVLCTSRVAFLTSGTSPNWNTRCVRSHLTSTETLRAIAPTGLTHWSGL